MGNVPTMLPKGVSAADGYEISHGSSLWEGPDIPPRAARECGNDEFLGIPISC